MKARITKRLLDTTTLPPGKAQLELADTDLPGFGARLGRSGWTFTLSYRVKGKRVRGESLGRYGVLAPDQARAEAQRQLAAIALGHELRPPASTQPPPEEPPTGPTFGALIDAYLAYAEAEHQKSRRVNRYRMKRHLDDWRPRLASDVTRMEVVGLVRKIGDSPCGHSHCQQIAKQRRAKVENPACRGHKVEANAVAATVRRIYSLAAEAETIPEALNPAAGLRRYLYRFHRRHDRSATAEEVKRLVPAIWGTPNPLTRAAYWLLLLTALRRDELTGLQWPRVNLTNLVQILPGRHKLPSHSFYLSESDTKAARAVVFPLSTVAREILASLPAESPWVFPSERHDDGLQIHQQWSRVRRRAGCAELKLHDLRATVSTWMARAGVDYWIRRRVLNHAPPADVTDRIYTDSAGAEEIRPALEDHGFRILEAAGVKSALELVWPDGRQTAQIVDLSLLQQRA